MQERGGRSYEVNNPTAKLLPAVCFAPGLFLRDGGEVLFSIILEYGVPWHFSLPCSAALFLKYGSKSQGENFVFGVFLFVPTPFGLLLLLLLSSLNSFVNCILFFC